VIGRERDAAGQLLLRVALTAPPVDGAANAALIAFLARRLELPKAALRIAAGETGRLKLLEIDIAPARLAAWLEQVEEIVR
jgi:uncharacterized protein YggU (UPF0235/DUF167 family)